MKMVNIVGRGSSLPYAKTAQNFIIFNHIERCGGTTLDSIFAKNGFEMHYAPTVYQWSTILAKISERKGPVFITGHAVWGIHEHLPADSSVWYITTLREPLSLCGSWYTANNQQVCTATSSHDFVHNERYYQNKMTTMLAGGDVGLAFQRLVDTYHSFGLLEHFDSYLHYLAHCFSLEHVDYKMGSVSFMDKEIFSSSEKSMLAKTCSLDVELYQQACTNLPYDPHLVAGGTRAAEKKDKVCGESRKRVSHKVYQYLQNHDPGAAIVEILQSVDYQDIWTLLRLQVLYRLARDSKGYEDILKKLDSFRVDSMKLDLAVFYAKTQPEKALAVLDVLLEKYSEYQTFDVESPLNTMLMNCLVIKSIIYKNNGDKGRENRSLVEAGQLKGVGDDVTFCLHRQERRISYFYEHFQ